MMTNLWEIATQRNPYIQKCRLDYFSEETNYAQTILFKEKYEINKNAQLYCTEHGEIL